MISEGTFRVFLVQEICQKPNADRNDYCNFDSPLVTAICFGFQPLSSTFRHSTCQMEEQIKLELVMQTIRLKPADGAKPLVISLRQASKPFDSHQMTRCHFPAVILPLNNVVM